MGCFKVVLDKLKRDVQKKMGNLSAVKINDDKFERLSEKSSDKSYKDLRVPTWLEDPRVPMDFSAGIGRIVQDPEEAAEIARSEKRGYNINTERQEASVCNIISAPLDVLRYGPHLKQKYYHGNMFTRIQTVNMLRRKATEGGFVVRDSTTKPGILVISYLYMNDVKHVFIVPIVEIDDETGDHLYVATCNGTYLFYDVHSLVEFHKLNLVPPFKTKLKKCVPNNQNRDHSPERNRRSLTDRLASTGIKQESIRRALTFNLTGTSGQSIELVELSPTTVRLLEEHRSATPTLDETQMLDLSLSEQPSGSGIRREHRITSRERLSPLEEVPSSGDSDSPPRM